MRPTGITANRTAATLSVSWDDGSASTISFKVLSDLCPCELCESERNNPDPLKIIRPRSYELEAINPVGSYAVNIMWKAGCHYGIQRPQLNRHCNRVSISAMTCQLAPGTLVANLQATCQAARCFGIS
jgi:DUF971 family protein